MAGRSIASRPRSSRTPSAARDAVYAMADAQRRAIEGFMQAETAALGPGVWQILNLGLTPDLDRVQDGTALLDHLFNEGLNHGVTKFIVRVPVDDPVVDLFRARGFTAYATEPALLTESVTARPAPAAAGGRPTPRDDELGRYL